MACASILPSSLNLLAKLESSSKSASASGELSQTIQICAQALHTSLAPAQFTATQMKEKDSEIEKKIQRSCPLAQSNAAEAKSFKESQSIEMQLKLNPSTINQIDIQYLIDETPINPLKDFYIGMAKGGLVNIGSSIFTDNLKNCIALIARCYRNTTLESYGLFHINSSDWGDFDNFVKKIKDKNFTKIDFKLIGGHEDAQELRDDIKDGLEEILGFEVQLEEILNPYKVIDDVFDDFDENHDSFCSNYFGFAVTAGITRNGYIYYALEGPIKKFQKDVITTLWNFKTMNLTELQKLAKTCKTNSNLQTFWLEFVNVFAAEYPEDFEKGLEEFKGLLSES